MTKKYQRGIIAASIFGAYVVFGSSVAEAKITVEGNREFRDDVNNCLTKYGGAPGVLGDVIKELQNSKKEHKIQNGKAWNNTPNDGRGATGGAGSGTVTRVDKAELEVYKTKFPELANKDFCAALLHELWHAVDADRGEWTDDNVDGVNKDEIEATMFQNFVHALRGVDPRTSYGGVDIGKHALAPGETVRAPEPEPAPAPAPKIQPGVSMSFFHVKPGEYSEVYATVTTTPGASVSLELSGPGVSDTAKKAETADANGVAKFTWKIVSYGDYVAQGTADGSNVRTTVKVK